MTHRQVHEYGTRNADGNPTDKASHRYLLGPCRFSRFDTIRKVMSVRAARPIAVRPQLQSRQIATFLNEDFQRQHRA